MTSEVPPPVPAGWYSNGEMQRYWDGNKWTEHTAPVAAPPPPPGVGHAPAPAPMAPRGSMPIPGAGGLPLMQFSSHIAGKNAQVSIYPDRVEWSKAGMLGSKKGTEMIPMRSISSVNTRKDGLINTIVQVTASGATIEMRVGHTQAAQVQRCLQGQMLR